MNYDSWRDVPKDVWRWSSFSPEEMACKGTGTILIIPEFMDKLQALRDAVGPLAVSSGFRSFQYNAEIGGAVGVHDSGRAVDLIVDRALAYNVLAIAPALGFLGIGIKQKGNGRFIHLDDLKNHETKGPRPTVWSY